MEIELDKIYAVWLREMKRYLNSKSRMLSSLGTPLFFMLAFGMGFGPLVPSLNYQQFIIPGIIGVSLLFTSMFSGVSIIWDREFGFLKEMLVTPTERLNIVIGRILGGASTSVIQGIIILAIGLLLGLPMLSPLKLAFTIALMLVVSSIFVALGIAIASSVSEVETFQFIMNFVNMPMFLLSSALFPVDKMPDFLQIIVKVNPMTYSVDAIRYVLLGQATFPLSISIPVLGAFLVAATLAASYLFERTSI